MNAKPPARASNAPRHGVARVRHEVDEDLRELLANEYFELAPPKSTGRERFGEAFFARHAAALAPLDTPDGCATLCALTVESIARELERHAFSPAPTTREAASLPAAAERTTRRSCEC